MAIVSYGYGDALIDEATWAAITPLLGSDNAVRGASDFAVRAVDGQAGVIAVAPGWAIAHGVYVQLTIETALTLQMPVAGSSWWCVCLRRNWTPAPGGATTLVAIQATGPTVPTTRAAAPGDVDEQPLALVQLTAGKSAPTQIVSVRRWPKKVTYVDSLAGMYDPKIGDSFVGPDGARYVAQVSIAGTVQLARDKRVASGSGPVQVSSDGVATIAHNLGWTPTYFHAVARVAGADQQVDLRVMAGEAYLNTTRAVVWAMRPGGALVKAAAPGAFITIPDVRWTATE